MPGTRVCGQCGAEVSGYSAEGLCPKCMLLGGLDVLAAGPLGAHTGSAPRPPQSETGTANPNIGHLRYFGDYELLEEIARGGMGVIYKARQVSLNRIVAVKMIVAGQLANAEALQRFMAEAEAAANLRHPNIVAIYEVGEHDGQHYFSMEYVEGQNLAAIVREKPLPGVQAAQYVCLIARAIQYAHERGTLHRDLKPSNVLLDTFDQPRITDFGLAKQVKGGSDLTLSGQVLGTPSFMPPEQAAGQRSTMGPASDVYSLGAILYHLLTGRPPFVAASVTETLRLVEEAEPVSPRLLSPSVPRDLETICLKCLEKIPAKRYSTAQALANELGRFLRGEPIQARPVSAPEKLWRWCRRKPALAASLTALTIAVCTGVSGIFWQWRNATMSELVTRRNLYAADIYLAQQALTDGNLGRARKLLEAHRPSPGQTDLRGFEWRYFWGLSKGDFLNTLPGHSNVITCVAFSPDGGKLGSCSEDKTLRLWDTASGRTLGVLRPQIGELVSLAFSPDGGAIGTGSSDGGVRVWDLKTGSVVFSHEGNSARIAFSPLGRVLAIGQGSSIFGHMEGSVELWDWTSGKLSVLLPESGGRAAFSFDGKMLATGSVGSSRVDLQACKLEYSIVSPK